ncbi:MAG: thioredoxin domain-containing protein, partial [Desulfomonilia bacterium]|nr:thioredoxin domain-containing protein [Desulfomonilia bacterium]
LKEASRQQPASTGEPSEDLLKKAFSHFSKSYDPAHGGFGTAPKFPQPHTFMFLLRYWKRTGDSRALSMVEETLSAMRRGGIYDQVGSGFHRYSTDRMWLVPHFEKMLYDQALLCMAYTEAYQAVPNETFRETVEDTIGYVLRDMRSEEGAFFTSEDADSAGEEGKFYLWTLDEIAALLPENDRDLAKTLFSIREEGNFREGMRGGFNIPYLDHDLDLYAREHSMNREDLVKRIRGIIQVLFAHRTRRIPPFKDDKILTDWNGLMIAALAKAFQVFGNPAYLSTAITAASFILSHQVSPDGRLMHLYREGISSRPGFLDDYAFLAWGLIDLYEASFNPSFLEKAYGLTKTTIEHFWDTDQGGFFLSPDDAEMELLRPKEIHDGAVPSGNSVALMNIVRLAGMTGDEELSGIARTIITASHAAISSAPSVQAFLLSALDFHLGPIHEIVIAGKRSDPEVCSMLRAVHERFLPNKILAVFDDEQPPHDILSFLTRNRSSSGGRAMAYVCRDSVCSLPAAETATLVDLLS